MLRAASMVPNPAHTLEAAPLNSQLQKACKGSRRMLRAG